MNFAVVCFILLRAVLSNLHRLSLLERQRSLALSNRNVYERECIPVRVNSCGNRVGIRDETGFVKQINA